ncbi:MAG: UDP-glucose/GDP-mannose dehydrogenase family protein [Planctomycetes bacterium]|nr:UDP-glucose/GDP-mannose dehydrogenase family protein [Planctomycetota bacterium]
MRVSVIGTGYVGLVAGACFADSGNEVLCLDIDQQKVQKLSAGQLTIYEPGLPDILQRNIREGRLAFSTDYKAAALHSKIYFLCLPTPPNEDGSADLRYVLESARTLAGHLAGPDRGQNGDDAPLFVLKSTVPVGTNARVRGAAAAILKGPFSVANNPEFLKEGTAVDDFMKPDRVVVGVTDDRSYRILHELYEPFCRTGAPILRMDPASAEIAKYAANGFLAVKISYINEVARLCQAVGADVEKVRQATALDPRIGKTFLFPGLGYGGSCLPKDTRALVSSARGFGLDFLTVDAAEKVNDAQKTWLIPAIVKHFGGKLSGRTLAIWGLAFKPRTDDVREAPSLSVIPALLNAGAKIKVFDPEAMQNIRAIVGDKIKYAENPYDALAKADALMLITEWNEFRSPDWKRIKSLLRQPVVFDGRNIYDPDHLRQMGFTYYGIGR